MATKRRRTLAGAVLPAYFSRLLAVTGILIASLIFLTVALQRDSATARLEANAGALAALVRGGVDPFSVASDLVGVRATRFDAGGALLAGSAEDGERAALEVARGALRPLLERDGFTVVPSRGLPQRYPIAVVAVPGQGHYLVLSIDATSVPPASRASSAAIVIVVLVLVTMVGSGFRVVREIGAPLQDLQYAANQFAQGHLDHRCVIPEPEEFGRLAETMNSMAAQLTTRIDAIRAQQNQLEAILANMAEGVVLLDDRLRVLALNDAARSLFRITTPQTGVARSLLEIIRNSEVYTFARQALAATHPIERSVVVYTAPPRYMQLTGSSLELDARRAAVIVFNDVTRLQELERIRRDFVANVSHELKTPVTAIQGFVETLQDGALADREEAERFLAIIASHTGRLTAIIEDLLQLSRLEQHNDELPVERVDLTELVESVRDLLAHRLAARSGSLEATIVGGHGAEINRGLVTQALLNLLNNALTYAPESTPIELTVRATPTEIIFSVRDHGPGIPADEQERVFERFYRVDRARSRARGGTGLGLAIVKHVAQIHGGSVELSSALGSGSTFTIAIPQPPGPARRTPVSGDRAAHDASDTPRSR